MVVGRLAGPLDLRSRPAQEEATLGRPRSTRQRQLCRGSWSSLVYQARNGGRRRGLNTCDASSGPRYVPPKAGSQECSRKEPGSGIVSFVAERREVRYEKTKITLSPKGRLDTL